MAEMISPQLSPTVLLSQHLAKFLIGIYSKILKGSKHILFIQLNTTKSVWEYYQLSLALFEFAGKSNIQKLLSP